MAFPYVVEKNFEEGTVSGAGFDSETDTGAQLDIAHYKDLTNLSFSTAAPFRGAYCQRLTLSGSTADAYLVEGDVNISAGANNFFRFYVWFSPDFTATADDTFTIFEGMASTTVEFSFGARVVSNVINFGIGETAPTSFSAEEIERGVWYAIELDVTVDSGGGDGTIDLYVSRAEKPASLTVAATQVGALTQGAITDGRIGVQDHLATTTGTILIDEFVQDDARIYPIKDRFDDTIALTKSGHAFVGRGQIEGVLLLSGAGTDCVLSVYDTNTGDANDFYNKVIELKNTANNEMIDTDLTVKVTRGAYVELSGTNPFAIMKLKNVAAHGSSASIRLA